jgi:PAS domain S-box-containing protein
MGAGLDLAARRKDGTEFPVDISLSAIATDEGMLISAAVRDVSERKLYESLLQSAPDAIVVVDATGTIRLVNRQVETLFGYHRTELLGRSVDMLVPLRVKDMHPQRRAGYTHDPRTRPMGAGLDLSARRKDGSEFPVDISLSAIQTKEGTLVSAAIRDISERKVAEERNRLAAIVDASTDAIVGQTVDGVITSWNPAAERLYGYTASEAIGRSTAMVYPPEGDELARTLETLRRGERIEGLEATRVGKDGAHIDVLVSVSPIRDEQGRIVGIASISRDMTEKFAAARQRERLEAELQQSQRLESVGQLAGGIAHDFNNLIAVILNYATFVSEELDDRPKLKEDVEEIHRAAERAAALTRQLLIFSRRELPHPEVIDLNSVVGDMRKLLQRTIGEHIELVTRTADDLWSVTADRGQIEQVIMNLAVNARDAMPQGGRLVIETSMSLLDEEYVAAYVALAPGRYVRLTVADTGTGMTPEVADRAFEPFFSTKPKGKGTGLGLATVYGIVNQSGGKVSLYSEPARGTSVTIHLPATASATSAATQVVPKEQLQGHGEHVLLVEDEAAVRVAARRILQGHGYSVFDAPTPAAAIQAASDPARRIDLVLTDVVMPEMSGLELAARLKEQRPSLRVIYMSGYPQEVITHQGLVTSELELIEKPFTREALLRAVAGALARDRLG